MLNFNTFDTKGYLQDFVLDTRGDSLHDQLIGTLELQDLNKKLLTVFLDIDMALMTYQNQNLMVIFTQNFNKCYDMIPDIVHTVVKRKIDEYSESEELKKIALYHLESLTLHVELKISHFPVIYDSISTRVLEINSGIMKEGHLACIKKMCILTVYDSSLYLLSRKYVSECDCYPEKEEINRVYKNPLNILKKEGFFNPMPTGSNFHYKFIRGKEEILCDRCEIPYKVKDSEDIYIECKIAEGIPIDKRGRPINSGSERINIWFQAPFQDYIKEGQTLSITGYYYAIPNFHWKKEGGGKVSYPLRIGCAAFNFCPFIENEIDIAIMDELEGASSLLTSDLNLTNLLNEPTQNLHLISRIKRHQKDRNNLISKLTQNQSVSSVPLSFAHITDVFCENPELADKENVEKWTDTELISKKLNSDMIAIRNLVKFIFNDKEYYTEDKKAYLYLFHFKLAMLLSIISLHSPVIETSCSDTTSVDSFALSSLASISTVDLDSNFSHINYTSSLLNLLLISDDTSHLLKLIKSTEQLCECVSLPAAIDAASLETFLKVNKDKIILVHFSYFKWGAQMRKIFYQILYRNQRGLKNPVWMVVDVKDIGDKKNKGLKSVLGSQIYDMFDICLTYDEDITRCIGVSVKKHYYMNTLQNLKLNDLRHQTKVKNLEFPDIINQNKCVCPFDQVDDLFDDLAENPLSVQDLISQYYCKRSSFLRQNKNDKNEEQTSIKITPNRLSTIYKLAETVNFFRSLYIKNQSSSDENLDLIDGIIAIFFNELTALSDKTIRYSDKQLLRSYCVERVLSRMEARPFYELIDDEESEETPQRGQIFKNLNKKHIQASYEEPNIAVKEKDKICIGCQNLYYQSKEDGKIPLLLADFPTTYIGLIKAIFSG